MSLRANHFLVLSLCVSLSFVLAGCCQNCGGDSCTPRSAWQSPTIQATRSLLLVDRTELRVILIDGKKAHPTCVSQDDVREYYLAPGEHSVTAVYRYASPPEEGFLAGMHGKDATRTLRFEVGRVYVAYYREHPGPVPEGDPAVGYVETNVINPPELYWSLEIDDVALAGGEPEVEEAQDYLAWVYGPYEPLGK